MNTSRYLKKIKSTKFVELDRTATRTALCEMENFWDSEMIFLLGKWLDPRHLNDAFKRPPHRMPKCFLQTGRKIRMLVSPVGQRISTQQHLNPHTGGTVSNVAHLSLTSHRTSYWWRENKFWTSWMDQLVSLTMWPCRPNRMKSTTRCCGTWWSSQPRMDSCSALGNAT